MLWLDDEVTTIPWGAVWCISHVGSISYVCAHSLSELTFCEDTQYDLYIVFCVDKLNLITIWVWWLAHLVATSTILYVINDCIDVQVHLEIYIKVPDIHVQVEHSTGCEDSLYSSLVWTLVWALWISSLKLLKHACWKRVGWSRLLLHCWSFNFDLPKLHWWRLIIQFWKSVQVIEQKHKSNYNRLHFLIYFLHILRSISTDFSLLQEWWINSIQKCLSTPKHCYQTLCNQLTKVTKTRNIKQTLCNQLTKVIKTRNVKQIWYSHKLQSLNC